MAKPTTLQTSNFIMLALVLVTAIGLLLASHRKAAAYVDDSGCPNIVRPRACPECIDSDVVDHQTTSTCKTCAVSHGAGGDHPSCVRYIAYNSYCKDPITNVETFRCYWEQEDRTSLQDWASHCDATTGTCVTDFP